MFHLNYSKKLLRYRFILIRNGSVSFWCMSNAEVAVQVFRKLESEDFRVLQIIEAAMSKREFVPKEQIAKYAKLPLDRVDFTLGKLNKLGLIYSMHGAYVGH